jgi:hypothetical protein
LYSVTPGQPVIRHLPIGGDRPRLNGSLAEKPVGEHAGAIAPEPIGPACETGETGTAKLFQCGPLPCPETHFRVMLLTKRDGLRVVISVNMGHEESLDILGPTLKRGKAPHETLSRLWKRPPRIDADEGALASQ